MFALHQPANKLPTFIHQKSLPKLPVPPLRATLDRYLKSLEPILKEEGKTDAEMQQRQVWAKEFEQGLGHRLQQRLIDLDRASPNNWLGDTLWLKKAYHEWRAPLLVNSNWWLLFHDDATIPKEFREAPQKEGDITPWQVRRSAWLAHRFALFKDRLDSQDIHPDSSRTGLWFRRPALRLYNLCRVPVKGCDQMTAPPREKDGRHMTVMIKNWVYAITIYDESGSLMEPKEIEKRIWSAVRDADAKEASGEKATPIGILTADERDTWAKNREHLLVLSPTNRASLTSIEQSLFCLSLDNYTIPAATTSSSSFAPGYVNALVRNCASGANGHNRWFDKALSVMVESNSRAGMNGEHSPCDALIPSIIVDWVVAEPLDLAKFDAGEVVWSEEDKKLGVERLEWVVDETIRTELKGASERANTLIADSDASQLWFDEYGADWMKANAKVSPDAYLQMALQLAWYKTQGYFTATYETASTRVFKHGRTDVIRTLSDDSRNFVKAMMDPSIPATTRYTLLQKATNAHNTYTRDASTGKGCDRHLMGLRLMIREGESTPALLQDELFSKSQEWKLSTSGLSAGDRFYGTGFGTVWPDGYGINYLAGAKLIKFGIESKHSCPETSTPKFQQNVINSLREMRAVVEGNAAEAPAAKL